MLRNILIFLLLWIIFIWAQEPPGFTVVSLDGKARVQHSEKYEWNPVSIGDIVYNEDIFETDYQTRLEIKFNENIIILGSNSKALINFKINSNNDSVRLELKLTLFNGAILTKTQKNCRLRVFTTNAIADADSATISIVADGKSGESAIQAISGFVNVRNITHSKGRMFQSGLTTMVLPNKEPSPALYMTNRHVTVLRQFFGDEFIREQLDLAGVKPTEEKSGKHLSFSKNYSPQAPQQINDEMYRSLFNVEKIYGSIVEDQFNSWGFYDHLHLSRDVLQERKVHALISTVLGTGHEQSFSSYALSLEFNYRFFDAGLRFAINEKEQTGRLEMDFSSTEAVLDKIDYITFGSYADSMFITAGSIDGVTFGNGLIVDGFRNNHPGIIYHNLGLNGYARFNNQYSIKAFVNNVADPCVGGVYLGLEPSSYYLGFGYFFDLDQQKSILNNKNFRYSPSVFPENVPEGLNNAAVHIGEFSIGCDIILNYQLKARIFAEIAQKISNGKGDGNVVRIPSLYIDFSKTHLGLAVIFESGRLISGEFNQFYMIHRNFIFTDSVSTLTTRGSVNSILSPERRAVGASLDFGINPVRGLDMSVKLVQNFIEKRTFAVSTDTSDSASAARLNYSLNLQCSINDSLIKFIRYAGIYFCENNGTYFPSERNPLVSWQSEAGIDIQTNPIMFNIAVESSLRYFYCENAKTFDNHINRTEHIIEWYFGILWGFL